MTTTIAKARLDQAGHLVGYAGGARYRERGDFLFQGIPLAGARVLEVGCGAGAWAIWAALHGATHVLGIEPEADGSATDTLARFRRAVDALDLAGRVAASARHLDELPASDGPFDVAILFNVINHLDEEAVTVLHRDPQAFSRYRVLLEDLRARLSPGSWVIVADCTRDNFWARLGLPSPVAPTIEWEKHQGPATWTRLFEAAGFRRADLRWSPLQPVPRLTANRLVQYFTSSHFVLRFRAT
jgi:SAM-dependent methyltransferase